MLQMILKLLVAIISAFFVGRLVSKIKLPAILGWLVAGMILGPHAISLISNDILNAAWYQTTMHVLECAVGLMIGTELVWKKIKKSGKSILVTTLTQSLGTFIVVTLVFGIVFYFMDIPMYLSFIFGGIALATAPAPALSIVREFKTSGPVTRTLIPMAALDDIVGCVVFFTTIAIIAGNLSAGDLPAYMIAIVVLLPLVIGFLCGLPSGLILKKERDNKITFIIITLTILFTSAVGFYFNHVVMPKPVLNFMLIGMAFSATFANMVSEERLEQIMHLFNPVLGVAMIIVILNLGAPLDYHLILGAGLFTAIYIVARAFGKYFGAYFGASVTKSEETVKKYLGLTLLPHSGVSLVFTGIAVSVLKGSDPASAQIVQGTIAAAAVINEIIAVILAKKGFEWAGEFGQKNIATPEIIEEMQPTIITISRQYGSGGRDIALKLSKALDIPFYDSAMIDMATANSSIDRSLFSEYESDKSMLIFNELAELATQGHSTDDRIFFENAKVIRDISKKESCIIVERCADYILKDRAKTINVFIYGDFESRKQRAIEQYQDDANSVEAKINHIDKKRSSYYSHYAKTPFGKADNYDICLNSSVFGIDECVSIIANLYNKYSN